MGDVLQFQSSGVGVEGKDFDNQGDTSERADFDEGIDSFTCTSCDGQSFFIMGSGKVECVGCGQTMSNLMALEVRGTV
jgi:hypothetical protein